MKLISLSKSVRTFGLTAMLSVMVATSLQQPIQAQNLPAENKSNVCASVPYEEFKGIKFSSVQKAAYRKIEAKINKRYNAISANAKSEDIPDGVLSVQLKPGVPDEKADEINKWTIKTLKEGMSTAQQVKFLNKMFGKYAIISLAQAVRYTPEQIAEGKRIGRDFEAQTMAILTPGQQKIYKVNLALQQRLQKNALACGLNDSPFDRIISPSPY